MTHGAGAWAGADSENGGIDSVSHAGRVDKGDWGGLAVIGDSSVGGVLAGVCPEDARRGTGARGRGGGTAWWCSGTTYRGTVAHELGHTWGVPHPDAFRQGFRCSDTTAYTNMQCHWEYAREQLLDFEITHLRSLSFFQFDTLPPYALLTDLTPLVRRRARLSRLEAGDSLAWVDGRGGGTGYPWAVTLGSGGGVRYPASGYRLLALDLGTERGSGKGEGGRALTVRLLLDGRPVALYEVRPGAPPQRVVVELRGARAVTILASRGAGGIVLGNPRLYR